MKIKCTNNVAAEYRLTVGKMYEATVDVIMEDWYWVTDDMGEHSSYYSNRFSILWDYNTQCRPIKDWKELHNAESAIGKLFVYEAFIRLEMLQTRSVSSNISINMDKEYILGYLKLFGFNVSFEQEHTLSQKEFDMLNWYKHHPHAIIKRESCANLLYKNLCHLWEPIPQTEDCLIWLEFLKTYHVSELLKLEVRY
jgi:hypothetical protein